MIVLLLTMILVLLFVSYFCTFKLEDTFVSDNNNNNNIILIGDSMLNNSAYVSANQSIPDILSNELKGNTVYNFAKDGSTINDCYTQLDKISSELNNSNTYIFVSCGGNNILNSLNRIDPNAITNLFDQYIKLLTSIKTRVPNAQLYVLNLYFPANTRYTSYHKTIEQWNTMIEDNISLGYKLIQTNKLLVLEDDFTYNIEPSFKGGQKIVDAIVSRINEI
jgi:lysophospholipase L1-like esterase